MHHARCTCKSCSSVRNSLLIDELLNDGTSEEFASKILCDARELMEEDEDEDEEKVKTQTDEEEQKEERALVHTNTNEDREFNHVERNKRVADAYSSRVERVTKRSYEVKE